MTFSSTIEEVNSTRRKFKISVPAASIQAAFSEVASEIQKSAEIRGFRKGKAPQALIRKFYLGDIVKKAADKVINKAYTDAAQNVDFQIVSFPHIEPENQFEEHNDFQFSATVDINPNVEIKDYQQIPLKMDKKFDINYDEELEKLLNSYSRALGKTVKDESGRAATKGDFVKVSYSIFHDGQEIKDKQATEQTVELNGSSLPSFEDAIIGLKSNDSKNFTVTYPEDYRDASLQGKTVEYHLTLNSVETLEPLVLDDEFAKRLGFATMDDARQNIKDNIQKTNENAKSNAAFEQVIDFVLATNSFDVADSLIESTIDKAIAEKNNTLSKSEQLNPKDDAVRSEFKDWAQKQVRGILALGHIARQEGISVTDDEMLKDLSSFAVANRIDPRELVKRAGAQIYDEFRGQVMIRKVIAKILETAQIDYSVENLASV